MSFSFHFSGDDIEAQPGVDEPTTMPAKSSVGPHDDAGSSVAGRHVSSAAAGAFPVAGRPLLPPTHHDLSDMLAQLPSKIAFGCLDVTLDNGSTIQIPRRELWDVRVQLMAEDEGSDHAGDALGEHDVKTGVYEGGFKSWESSVDLVKVLAAGDYPASCYSRPARIIELGCGTALPSVALFQWALSRGKSDEQPLDVILADYNPSVVQLVTLPNFLLAWALHLRHQHPVLQNAFSLGDELELGPEVLQAFQTYLSDHSIRLSFLSGAWSDAFVQLLYQDSNSLHTKSSLSTFTLLLGSETIYSPLALQAFTEMVFAVLNHEMAGSEAHTEALVAAKKLYFGVGGSLSDFVHNAEERGAIVTSVREENEGVRRGVVRCVVANAQ